MRFVLRKLTNGVFRPFDEPISDFHSGIRQTCFENKTILRKTSEIPTELEQRSPLITIRIDLTKNCLDVHIEFQVVFEVATLDMKNLEIFFMLNIVLVDCHFRAYTC